MGASWRPRRFVKGKSQVLSAVQHQDHQCKRVRCGTLCAAAKGPDSCTRMPTPDYIVAEDMARGIFPLFV